ncbi:MAG: hypothetical protein K5848_08070 [Lachnospiraceae bacterium]|nr:hypothetical protein [Lachnospiraceae bacterium]
MKNPTTETGNSGSDLGKAAVAGYESRFIKGRSARILDSIRPDEELDETVEEIHIVEAGSAEEAAGVTDVKETIRSYISAYLVLAAAFAVIGTLLINNKAAWLFGSLLGILSGLFYIWHLKRSLGLVLNLSKEAARKKAGTYYMLRAFVILASACVAGVLFGAAGAASALTTLLSLKFAVYLSLIFKRKGGNGNCP